MFRQHLWGRVQILLRELGRHACVSVDQMYVPFFTFCRDILLINNNRAGSVPRWRGLNHFNKYVDVEFTDGSKWEDMSKVCRGPYLNVSYW